MARRTKKGAGVGAPGVSTPPESPKKTTENAGSKHHRKTQKDDARSNTRLYDLLRVKSEATQAEITKSYRALALLLHPDKVAQKLQREESAGDAGRNKGGKSFEDLKEEATKHFQELQAAYEVLKDPRRRKLYDETGTANRNRHFEHSPVFLGVCSLYTQLILITRTSHRYSMPTCLPVLLRVNFCPAKKRACLSYLRRFPYRACSARARSRFFLLVRLVSPQMKARE